MVDDDLIRANPLAMEGIRMLHHSGVLKLQQERLLSQLASGDADESNESLAERVKVFRRQSQSLEALIQMGQQLVSEQENPQ